MKKIISLLVLVLFLFCLASCNVVEYYGIENYSEYNSEYSLSRNLLPSSDYLQKFNYVAGDYEYIDTGLTKREHEIMYLVYEDNIYNNAKTFVFENMVLSKTNHFLYNQYEFYENIGRKEFHYDHEMINEEFPYRFNMIGFNDEKNTIIFMSLRISQDDISDKDKQILTFEDMNAFLKEYFSFYDFDA